VTLDVSVREAEALTSAALDWAVPGHLEAKVEHYLRALPKELRRGFVPLGETAKTLAARLVSRDRLTDRREALTEALAAQIAERFRVAIDPAAWADKPLPDHLRVRVRVVDAEQREIVASRELEEVHAALHAKSRAASAAVAREDPASLRAARTKWETPEHTNWAWPEMPERVLVSEQAGAPVYAFPGLRAGTDGVARKLFKTPEEARAATRIGLTALFERQLGNDLGWLERDLRAVREVGPLAATLASVDTLREHAFGSIRRWVTGRAVEPLDATTFGAVLDRAKSDLRGLVPRFVDLLREILAARQELLVLPHRLSGPGGGSGDADAGGFPAHDALRAACAFAALPESDEAAGRAREEKPAKDAERAAQLAPYVAAAAKGRAREGGEAFRWLVEEFRVSSSRRELGTAEPVSAVKLDRALAALQVGGTKPERDAPPLAAKPIVSAPVAKEKSARLKNLGALDKLFPR